MEVQLNIQLVLLRIIPGQSWWELAVSAVVEAVEVITELAHISSQMDIECESCYEIPVSITPKVRKTSFHEISLLQD